MMRVLPFWTLHVFLLVLLLFGLTSCDFVEYGDEEVSKTQNEAFGTPNYDRLDESKKACSSVISSTSELKIDDTLISRIKDELVYSNGDWDQEGAGAPLVPFDDRPLSMSSAFDYDLHNSSHLKLPFKRATFKLTDVSRNKKQRVPRTACCNISGEAARTRVIAEHAM